MEIQQLDLKSVYPSPMNPRKTFDEEALKELADNIEKQGLLQPITVRAYNHPLAEQYPKDYPTRYEIVCGERRYRATKMLSDKWSEMDVIAPSGSTYNRYSKIPAIVREMTDEEAFDAMITENLQRKDVDPMEEAFAFAQLVKKGDSMEEIASRFGKSVRFVQDRVKLNALIPELRLAVKDGKMPIVAAMIICKLTDDLQRKYYGCSGPYTKQTAESFVHAMFMTIDNALWTKNGKADFTGGCDRKCSECSMNTANHGCLFYEMKATEGCRCTDRRKFHEKTMAYILSELEIHADVILREGEKMEQGKIAVCIDEFSANGETKELVAELTSRIRQRGFAVNTASRAFKSKCYYKEDDPRLVEFLRTGAVHPVFILTRFSGIFLQKEYWYAKGFEEPALSGLPRNVDNLINQYKQAKDNGFAVAKKCATALVDVPKPTGPLTLQERALSLACKIHYSGEVLKKIGLFKTAYPQVREIVEMFVKHPELIDQIERELIAREMSRTDGLCQAAIPYIDEIGAQWDKGVYETAKAKAENAVQNKLAKIEKELKDLGYDTKGNKLEDSSLPHLSDYTEMKGRFNDGVCLFRVGDFYEVYKEDAEFVSKTIGLTLTTTHRDGEEIKLCGFPHHALDSYMPKIIAAGKRVALCEKLKDK